MSQAGDAIAECVLERFKTLPQSAKPRTYPDGSSEWVPLSGIVISQSNGNLQCVALGTGMRCLPASKLEQANGYCLHDWHAEVVAIRSFNAHVLSECATLAAKDSVTSELVRRRLRDELTPTDFQPFTIKEDIEIYFYCSEAPCGDASMELIMQAQDDATPWPAPKVSDDSLKGRGNFSELGVVRRKPARGDAPESLSKSCSDKIALKQCTSLLSSVTSLIVHPSNAYIHSLVVPESQFIQKSYERAFSKTGRLYPLTVSPNNLRRWPGGYGFRPFSVQTTAREFSYSKRAVKGGLKSSGSNITAAWTPQVQQALIGGSIQGNKQFSIRGSSFISRASLWKSAAGIASLIGITSIQTTLRHENYNRLKQDALLQARQIVKEDVRAAALKGWKVNKGDDHFGIELVN